MEAVIKTTKGDISVYLYPEAAPKNVANFVYLAKIISTMDLLFTELSRMFLYREEIPLEMEQVEQDTQLMMRFQTG